MRHHTVLTRMLGACGRCERQRIRCIPDDDDPCGPCLTCIRAKRMCPRFEKLNPASVPFIPTLLPHKVDVYRVHVQSFNCSDEQRLYIIEKCEFAALDNIRLPISDLTSDLNRFLHNAIVPLLLVTFNSKNHNDSEDFKWDAVQLGYKLSFNPLVYNPIPDVIVWLTVFLEISR
ncbi:hypothetical protein CC78DRAFT_112817 [Lojkania enalia]|uniref:Zn(2)-C6 fungal-type domain-containing protein n=1 Tax=Lojkania enalia TaxID=147567 RepID=A0A9P4JWP9_9PLEO|nr:hypothetical protein CC78DRAFT_112817 [Didymosphaeria enalia]